MKKELVLIPEVMKGLELNEIYFRTKWQPNNRRLGIYRLHFRYYLYSI